MLNTKLVNTQQLKNGDVIEYYACVFQLKNRTEYDDGAVRFDTDCLVYSAEAGMPHHWVDRDGGFTIQGNERAHWALLVEPK